jgi:pimeloyl-ACP methyl ester carboxylesterase
MQLHFRKFGEGKPLIILHGLFGQSDNWNTLAKKFAEHSLFVYTVDLRNHGLSPHTDTMSYSEMANDVRELIESENINQPILLGHSMGGKVAMWVDYLFPNTLSKIIVVDIAPKKYPSGHTDVFNALNAVDFSVAKTRKDVEIQIRKHLLNEAVIQFLLKNVYWETPEKLNWRFNLSAIENHYEEILNAVPDYSSSTPALFIKGELSNYITNEDIEDIQKHYPNYHLVSIPKAGHWVHAEQPQIFMEEVLKFISI